MKIPAHSIDMVVLSTRSETIQNRDSILCPSALATKPTWVLPANLVKARPKISPCEKLRNLRVLNDSVYKSHSRGCSPAAWSRASRPCYPWATGHNTMKNKFNGRLWKIDIQKNHVPPNWLKKLISDLSWNSKILGLAIGVQLQSSHRLGQSLWGRSIPPTFEVTRSVRKIQACCKRGIKQQLYWGC